ncbi:MAG: N-acetylmuramoyl-L-alanine amidase [Anaerolineales bacterium]|nr:N-acetylmuramoyl-L-alanine amidase [Anaerolineales bacterium]
MKWKFYLFVGIFCLFFAYAQRPVRGETAVSEAGDVADLWFEAADFTAGSGEGYQIEAAGLTMVAGVETAVYTSPILTAPIPFNAVVPRWLADVPEGTELEIMLRTATKDGDWTPWHHSHPQDDWMLPGQPDIVGDMIVVPDTTSTHHRIQFSISFSHSGDAMPTLQQLRLTFIDSTGPTATELAAQQQAIDAQLPPAQPDNGYPKPMVISREVWCFAYYGSECYYSDIDYYPVTHLIVHHTVSANDYTDGAAVVRAIWRYHNYTNGWGDIGYNYLVDLDGNLYEGHLVGDNAVGTHASGANRGSMALSFIGTFNASDYPGLPGIAPPPELLASAAELLAWKADQRDINVFEASDALPDIPWGLPNLMGHRDVYGGTRTECPGDQAYAMLPWLRQAVAERIGLTDPHLYTDEMSNNFTKSNANWYEGERGCGHNGHSYYTWSTTNPGDSTNWGEWRPEVPATGRYEIEVYIPYCDTGASETNGARYTVQGMNGTSTVVLSQDNHVGLWASLGEFDLTAGTGNVIRLSDLTTTDEGRGVWFDAIRLRPVEGVALLAQPAADSWLGNLTVNFAWSFTNPLIVTGTRLQVATDENFNNLVVNQEWATAVTNHTYTFGQQYANLYWRVIMTSSLGNNITSAVRHFGLDVTAPDSAVYLIYQYPGDDTYYIVWHGSDTLSGIAHYIIEYRAAGDASWTSFRSNTSSTTAPFTPPNPDKVYWFRSQAIDQVGNIEPPNPNGDTNTSEAILFSHVIMLPVISH